MVVSVEIRVRYKLEIAHLADSIAEAIRKSIEALRKVIDRKSVSRLCLTGNCCRNHAGILPSEWHLIPIYLKFEIIVLRVRRRKREVDRQRAVPVLRILEDVVSGEANLVG